MVNFREPPAAPVGGNQFPGHYRLAVFADLRSIISPNLHVATHLVAPFIHLPTGFRLAGHPLSTRVIPSRLAGGSLRFWAFACEGVT